MYDLIMCYLILEQQFGHYLMKNQSISTQHSVNLLVF